MARRPGVFCLQGEWGPLTDRSSMEPLLRALEGLDLVRVVHKDVATVAELNYHLTRWSQRKYSDYLLGYLAFHGRPSEIQVGQEVVSLDELGNLLADRCTGRILHFGSCSVLRVDEASLKAFLRRTGARAVCGYTKDVDWLQALLSTSSSSTNSCARSTWDTRCGASSRPTRTWPRRSASGW